MKRRERRENSIARISGVDAIHLSQDQADAIPVGGRGRLCRDLLAKPGHVLWEMEVEAKSREKRDGDEPRG